MNSFRRIYPFLAAAVAGLLAMLLYRQALGFGFFNDDPTGHFAWMADRSIADFFISSADYGYYRPVVFTVLRLVELPFGGHNPVANHALLLLLHGANVAMIWLLAYVLSQRAAAFAWAAALLFAAVPFSYEAVIYVASLTHPLLLFWLLLTLLLYYQGRQSGRKLWGILSFVTLCLSLLTHENGLLIFPAIAGVEWLTSRPSSLRAWLRPIWFYALPPLLFVPLWFAIPKSGDPVVLSWQNVAGNAVPFLQTLVFPFLNVFGLESLDIRGLLVLVVVALVVTLAAALGARAGRLWLFALGWVILSSLPAVLFLSPDYLYGSPRLHYVTGVGVALLWSLPVLWLWVARPYAQLALQENRVTWAGRLLLSGAYLLMLTLPGLPFIQCQVDFYAEATGIVERMAATAVDVPPDRDLVFINLPFFFSSYAAAPDGCPNPYPWTPVGAVVVPPYARATDFVRYNGGPVRPVTAVSASEYGPGWRTAGAPVTADWLREAVAGGKAVYAFDLLSTRFLDVGAVWQPYDPELPAALASFEPGMELVAAVVRPGDGGIPIDLTWRVVQPPADLLATFIHLYAPDGTLVAQADAPPGGGAVPQSLWRAGDLLHQKSVVEVDPGTFSATGPGQYDIKVGLYRASDGVRLTAEAGGQPVPDSAYQVGEIAVAE